MLLMKMNFQTETFVFAKTPPIEIILFSLNCFVSIIMPYMHIIKHYKNTTVKRND